MAKTKTSAAPKRERRRRGSITADDIITGAFEIATQESLANLSMPLLAKHLDVGVTSIYWYFRKKEDLLDAMTERASEQYHFITPFVGDDTWQVALRSHFQKMRGTFVENPVLVDLILMRTGMVSQNAFSATIEKLESIIAKMVEAGFSPEVAFDVYMSLSLHTSGSVVLEHLHLFKTASDVSSELTTPMLHDLAGSGHSPSTISTSTFDFTLEAIVSKAESLLQG